MSSGSAFRSLKDCPCLSNDPCLAMYRINSDECIVISSPISPCSRSAILFKYSSSTNEWKKHGDEQCEYGPSCIDPKTKLLYVAEQIYRTKAQVIVLDVEQRNKQILYAFDPLMEMHSLIMGDRYLHVFYGFDGVIGPCFHEVVDVSEQSWTVMHRSRINVPVMNVIYSKFRKSLIALYQSSNSTMLREYGIETKQWSTLKWSKDRTRTLDVCNSCIVSVANGEYVIQFGHGQIVVYDFNRETSAVSALECPCLGICRAESSESSAQNELAVFGFINQTFTEPQFESVSPLPRYLIQMMAKWYSNEVVHLLIAKQFQCSHWQINVDNVIARTK